MVRQASEVAASEVTSVGSDISRASEMAALEVMSVGSDISQVSGAMAVARWARLSKEEAFN